MRGSEKKRPNGRNKKKAAMVITLLCVAALLMSGTFAYYNSVKAINTFQDDYYTDIILHDDYDVDGDEQDGSYHEKKVYVENVGEIPLFVRITLEEYMEYDYKSYPSDAVRKSYGQSDPGDDEKDRETSGGTDSIMSLHADLSGENNWHIHSYSSDSVTGEITCADCGEVYHNFFSWILGGDGYVHNGAADWISSKDSYKYRKATHEEIEEGVARRYQDGRDTWDDIDLIPERYDYTNGGQESAVISMQEYWQRVEADELDQETWTGWILDEDGYAYWSQKLPGGETTGVLLGAIVEEMRPPGDEYYYGIDVILEAVDEADLNSWLYGSQAEKTGITPRKAVTSQAAKLLEGLSRISERNAVAAAVAKAEPGETVEIGIEGLPGYSGDTIEWIVLSKDGSTAELITKDILMTRQFHNVDVYNWDTSDIKKYLQNDFRDMLAPDLQEIILEIEKDTWDATQARNMIKTKETIYLLSEPEIEAYWPNENDSARRSGSTALSGAAVSYWFVRSSGLYNSSYATTSNAVTVSNGKFNARWLKNYDGIRPALTVRY